MKIDKLIKFERRNSCDKFDDELDELSFLEKKLEKIRKVTTMRRPPKEHDLSMLIKHNNKIKENLSFMKLSK